jgi:hypothetical protein
MKVFTGAGVVGRKASRAMVRRTLDHRETLGGHTDQHLCLDLEARGFRAEGGENVTPEGNVAVAKLAVLHAEAEVHERIKGEMPRRWCQVISVLPPPSR